jgi:hypothetical protein
MATDRFPYDLPSRQALVRLIQEIRPRFGLTEATARFEKPFLAPTPTSPGRTFIEVENTDINCKKPFVYRRLDFGIALKEPVEISLSGAVTPKAIVEEINRVRGMYIGPEDTSMAIVQLAPVGMSFTYRLKARPDSLVWYGEADVNITSLSIPDDARLMENGDPRLLEDGSYRLMEST